MRPKNSVTGQRNVTHRYQNIQKFIHTRHIDVHEYAQFCTHTKFTKTGNHRYTYNHS